MNATTISSPGIRVVDASVDTRASNQPQSTYGVLAFLGELRRRRVCRTVTAYSLALWLVCQIVDVVIAPLGLPAWTLKFVIVVGLIGFPIALILSWLFKVTNEGVVPDKTSRAHTAPRRPGDWIVDCTLLIAATIIGVQLATGALSVNAEAAMPAAQRIAVLPFRATVGEGAEAVTDSLVGELQHELAVVPQTIVIAPRENYFSHDSLSLTGTVSVTSDKVRARVALIDNGTGEITWSQVFERPNTDPIQTPLLVARDIVSAMPLVPEPGVLVEGSHES